MLIYDDTTAEVLHAAADEARRLGATRYETAHVLLGLLRTADPVTRTVAADHPPLTVDDVRAALGAAPGQPAEEDGGTAGGRRRAGAGLAGRDPRRSGPAAARPRPRLGRSAVTATRPGDTASRPRAVHPRRRGRVSPMTHVMGPPCGPRLDR